MSAAASVQPEQEPSHGAAAPAPGSLRHDLLWATGILLLNFAVLSAHIFSHERLAGIDGMYHLRMAQLYLERGIFTDFPWMQHAFTREFWVDHHLLYHLLLIPLTVMDLMEAQRWAGAIMGALALTACSLYLLRLGVGRVWAFAPLLLLSSDQFLFRMMLARSMSLGVIFIVAVLYLLERRRWWGLLVASFLFMWSYHAAVIIAPLAMATVVMVRVLEGRWDLRPLLYGCAGLILGLTGNPFFPDSFRFLWFHVLPLLRMALGEQGPVPAQYLPTVAEWGALRPWTWITAAVPALVAGLAVPLACLPGRRQWPAGLWVLCGTAAAGLAASFISVRAFEYTVPLAFLGAARVLHASPPAWPRRWRRAAAGAALALLLGFGAAYHADLSDDFRIDPTPVKAAAAWLERNTPAGSTVFNADYTLWSYLFMYNTHNTYVLGYNPLWLFTWDRERYLIYRAVGAGHGRRPVDAIRDYFGCQYAIVLPWDRGLLRRLQESPRARRVYGDPHALIYRVD